MWVEFRLGLRIGGYVLMEVDDVGVDGSNVLLMVWILICKSIYNTCR